MSQADPVPGGLVLRLSGVTRRFGPLLANDAIDLELSKGEVLALLGENGAGKTTLMNILFGHYVADQGTIEVADGKGRLRPLPPGDPAAALKAGIGMVHQHFALADNLSVLDNLLVGTEPLWRFRSDRKRARGRVAELMARTGLAVPLDLPVSKLSVGERQRVEILKALNREVRILILDEPTAVLTPQESEGLFGTLRGLAAGGLGVIFISHKLPEVLAVSDRLMVLRAGRVVLTARTGETDRARIAEAMVGRAIPPTRRTPRAPGPDILRFDRVEIGPERAPALKVEDLAVRSGEIVGIAGVSGNGQALLSDLVAGRQRVERGSLLLDGGDFMPASPADAVRAGIGRIPEERNVEGIVGDMTVAENLILESYRDPAIQSRGVLRLNAVEARARAAIAAYDVRCPGPQAPIRLLSGGNIQKLVLSRALDRGPRLVLANQPTRGLDVGAVAEIHGRLLAAREAGAGVLLISEDLDELLQISDRLGVIHRGRLSAAMPVESVTIERLGLMMAGHDVDAD